MNIRTDGRTDGRTFRLIESIDALKIHYNLSASRRCGEELSEAGTRLLALDETSINLDKARSSD